ncbi:hypothetical protein [Streptomyces sp. NPDC051132]|uniref:hypothetical protein n=1 Tax=unclassified Streptomyces TaxID=2593676 RepID=UPI003428D294
MVDPRRPIRLRGARVGRIECGPGGTERLIRGARVPDDCGGEGVPLPEQGLDGGWGLLGEGLAGVGRYGGCGALVDTDGLVGEER